MNPLIGIDLGTTYSCLAGMIEGAAKVIPNLEGAATTPSMVCLASTGETLVGNLAMRQSLTNPERTLFAIKRLIGQKFGSARVQEARRHLPYALVEAANGDVQVKVGERRITPQEVSALILGYLKKSAEAYYGTAVREAVVTVPAHFDDNQRQATKDAALIAGLDVLRVINEPTAASLAYGLHRKRAGKVAVFDMGGGTFDITLLEISEGVFHVLATAGDSYLGGEDFDRRLVDWLLTEFKRETREDLSGDKYALQRIKEAAEKAKRELSFTQESEINLPFIASASVGSRHLRRTLTRPLLEELTRDLVEKAFPLVEGALAEAGLRPGEIEDIILVGGQTRMPLLRRQVADFFGRAPNDHLNPDEGVALGAAIQAGILSGEMSEIVLLLDVTSLSLGIEIEQDGFERIIEKNATLPVRKTKPFTTVEDGQRRVRIHVLQGESGKASENTSLGMFDLVGISAASAGIPQIDVTFEIDVNGMVRVSARDTVSGREQKMVVEPSSGLSRSQKNEIMKQASAEGAKNG
ncbi:MAG: molecular chaperone DnaK [Acidobacteriota bacterium]|nr:molecular chaperone DnaK [Acidobacteriota bacterium]